MSRKTAFLYRIATIGVLLLAAGSSPSAVATDGPDPAKVAVIDVGRLLQDSVAGQRAVADLRALKESHDAEQAPVRVAIVGLRKRIEDGTLSLAAEALEELRKELEERTIELQRLVADGERRLEEEERTAFSRIQDEVMPIIDQAGNEGGYSLIFNKYDSGLVFAAGEVDITDLILERYNTMQETEPQEGADG